MLEFERVVLPEHEVNQNADDHAVFSKQAGGLIDAQSSRTRREGDEICIASETVELFCQNTFDVLEVTQSLESLIEPFGMDEWSRRRHLLAQIELLCYPQRVLENFAFRAVVLGRRRRDPLATID